MSLVISPCKHGVDIRASYVILFQCHINGIISRRRLLPFTVHIIYIRVMNISYFGFHLQEKCVWIRLNENGKLFRGKPEATGMPNYTGTIR